MAVATIKSAKTAVINRSMYINEIKVAIQMNVVDSCMSFEDIGNRRKEKYETEANSNAMTAENIMYLMFIGDWVLWFNDEGDKN